MSEIEKVILIKHLFKTYKGTLNLTQSEEHEIEMWLDDII